MSQEGNTKEAYIAQCMTTGKSKEECEQAWLQQDQKGDKPAPMAQDYATLFKEHEMTKVKLQQTTDMLREATKIIERINEEKDAREIAEKFNLATQLERLSEGRLKHADLMKESMEQLSTRMATADQIKPTNSVSVAMLMAESEEKRKPQLSVGQWDPIKKQWIGGV